MEFSGGLYDKLYEISNNLYRTKLLKTSENRVTDALYGDRLKQRHSDNQDYGLFNGRDRLMIRSELSACTAIIENLLDEKISRPSLCRHKIFLCDDCMFYCRLLGH